MESPEEFPFPFVPYKIQTEFMKNLYQALENGKIGIFESPTGTGKSMSLICGTLTWLRDYERNRKEQLKQQAAAEVDVKSEPTEIDWVSEFFQKRGNQDEQLKAKNLLKDIGRREEKLRTIIEKSKVDSLEPSRKRTKYSDLRKEDRTLLLLEQAKRELDRRDNDPSGEIGTSDNEEDLDLLLADYESDDESGSASRHAGGDNEEDADDTVIRVYYCSRTHSQLTQFIKEIQKSSFNNAAADGTDEARKNSTQPDTSAMYFTEFFVTVAALASRQGLCINDSVRRLPTVQQMNDRCLDLQKSNEETKTGKNKKISTKKQSSCCFKSASAIENLSDRIIGKIQDIEELVGHGKDSKACPYYAARRAAAFAQIIVVPYQILMHSATRKASGIKLKGSVVIIDEAHNLVDTIANIHSVEVTFSQVQKAHSQLEQYVRKFSKRLKAENLMYVKRILYILRKFLAAMGLEKHHAQMEEIQGAKDSPSRTPVTETCLMKINDFLFKTNLDNLNLFKVLRYCERSLISKKLNGFVERYAEASAVNSKKENTLVSSFLASASETDVKSAPALGDGTAQSTMRSPLMHIESFLLSLTSANEDGRIAITTVKHSSDVPHSQLRGAASIKFLLLNPAQHFKDIVEDCRAVIVAGGTMQPCSSFINQLLSPLAVRDDKIFQFSCGHVIDKDQLLPVTLSQGPAGTEFEFTFARRKSTKLIDELGRSLCNLCNVIPGGIVCFFPSYDYESVVYARWSATGILKQIETKKKIFRESRKGGHVDRVLADYSTSIQRTKAMKSGLTGALLLSVVGGKMSEGINFSDDLGRCIIMVGLPYPNLYSAELKEKMAYLDANMPNVGTKTAGQSYYENLCMKAVNQSIGRAIRHRHDYAAIVLADKRYNRSDVKSQLPGWISDKFHPTKGFGEAFGAIRQFFKTKKQGPTKVQPNPHLRLEAT